LIEDANIKLDASITFELILQLNNDMFNNLFSHSKNKCEMELLKKKEPMVQTYEFVKEICDTFTEIRFDDVKKCFYNESEEIAKWDLKEEKEETTEYTKKPKREGCDCCMII